MKLQYNAYLYLCSNARWELRVLSSLLIAYVIDS